MRILSFGQRNNFIRVRVVDELHGGRERTIKLPKEFEVFEGKIKITGDGTYTPSLRTIQKVVGGMSERKKRDVLDSRNTQVEEEISCELHCTRNSTLTKKDNKPKILVRRVVKGFEPYGNWSQYNPLEVEE